MRKGQKQYMIDEAKKTRVIIKVFLVLESGNSRIKQWHFFNNIVPDAMTEKIRDYFEIVCALINCYRPIFVKKTSKDKEIADKILQLAGEANKIKEYVEKLRDKNGKQSKWTNVNAINSVDSFPKMSFNELQELTLGSYQLKQAD